MIVSNSALPRWIRRSAARGVAGLVLALAIGGPAQANEFANEMAAAFAANVAPWLASPAVVDAIRAQNADHASLADDDIAALDARWRSEIEAGGGPLVDKVLATPLSAFLRERAQEADPVVTEVFVMDNRGLNVGTSIATSDYMQGDEAKWRETFAVGPDAVHVGDLEFDKSTNFYQAQYSATVVDPETGEAIGAITVGMRIEALM